MNRTLSRSMMLMLLLCLGLALYLLFVPEARAQTLVSTLDLNGVPCQVQAPLPQDYPSQAAAYRCPPLDKKTLKASRDALPYGALGIPDPQGLKWEYDTSGVYMMDKVFNPGAAYPWRIDLKTGALRAADEGSEEVLKAIHRDDSPYFWDSSTARVTKTLYSQDNVPGIPGVTYADSKAALQRAAAALDITLGTPQTIEVCEVEGGQPLYYIRSTALVGGLPLMVGRSNKGWQGNGSDVPLPCSMVYGQQGVMEICLPLTGAYTAAGAPQKVLSPQEALQALEKGWDEPACDMRGVTIDTITLCALGFSKKGNWSYGYDILPVWRMAGTQTYDDGDFPFDAFIHATDGYLLK